MDYLAEIAAREAANRSDTGARQTCTRCSNYKANPPRKICHRCRARELKDTLRKLAKARKGQCITFKCPHKAMPGSMTCINHGGAK